MRLAAIAVTALLSACADNLRPSAPTDTQVVAQWLLPQDANPLSLQRYFIAEEVIRRECRQLCSEDGNDVGSGAFNVYLYAPEDDIDATVAMLARLHEAGRLPRGLRVGVAQYNADRTDWSYRPVYPDGLDSFSPM